MVKQSGIANSSFVRRAAFLVWASFAAAACGDTTANDALADKAGPSVDLVSPTLAELAALPDTTLSFAVRVKDNLGIKSVHVALSGGHVATFDTTFTSAITDIELPLTFTTLRSVPPGTPVLVVATATDGAGNRSKPDTLKLTVGNVGPADVKLTSPTSGTLAVVGKSIIVSVSARTIVKVRSVGFTTTGAYVTRDSVILASPLKDSVSILDTLSIPSTVTPGPTTIIPFVIDSLGQKTTGQSVTITVQAAASVNSTPVVTFGLTSRAEVTDTIHVEATDQTGITTLGYEVRRTPGGTIDARDSIISNGNLTSQLKTFSMKLPYSTFPTTVYVQAFARNSNGVRAYAKLAGSIDRVDTVTIVAGTTRSLPLGGLVADALYHPNTDRLYLTNILRNTVEVFNFADSSFKTPIVVGSRPWGIAPWPVNRSGAMANRLLVANSGGTDISILDIAAGTGREVSRYALPNLVAFSITTVTSQTSGLTIQQRTKYDFSDRPQFLAATCTDDGAGGCADVIVVYSTTPTPGQSVPFTGRNGTLRWENITRGTSHLFFEQALGQTAARADTLEIIREDANTGAQTVLLPYRDLIGPPGNQVVRSTVVDLPALAFRDTTFVRNSGDFRRAVFGEGGSVLGSRAIVYDVTAGTNTPVTLPDGSIGYQTTIDRGVGPATNVSDFIANTFTRVQGVAMNFDGSLAAVRGDSTYILSNTLRLRGILPTTAANAGIDFHPQNRGPLSFPLSTRLAFAASAQPVIEVYDTNCYQRIATVPVRDPIIGPIKAAIRPFSGQLVLVGATAQGVVIVTLDNTFTTTCP
jgi:hypothetical protein